MFWTVLILLGTLPLQAEETVVGFDHMLQDASTRNVEIEVVFPPATERFERIELAYQLSCPESPGDCDPWDRTARLFAMRDTDDPEAPEALEIARVITPYDITGSWGGQYGTGPDSCAFVFDLTDYLPVLRDTVTLRSYIDTWVGGGQGWLVTTTFTFFEGVADPEPYEVIRIWENGYVSYGNPNHPWTNYIEPQLLNIDPDAISARLRMITTGHGFGNTDNAAEFSNKVHHALVGVDMYSHFLWRDDCAQNPCSGQGGTWWYNRAGWCPGSGVIPWDNDFTPQNTNNVLFDYWAEGYINECRPDNPDCVSGVTCSDCNNSGQPYYIIQGQLILYREPTNSLDEAGDRPRDFLLPAAPNPFNPQTTIRYDLGASGPVRLSLHDLAGREVRVLLDARQAAGSHHLQLNAANLASGIYVLRMQSKGTTSQQKLLLLK
jgi:hypothetical protein